MNWAEARKLMVQQQISPYQVTSPGLLDAFNRIPRERFVAAPYQHLAYSEAELPIGQNQVMIPPALLGRLIQALEVSPRDRALVIGAGTGYSSALLSLLAKDVIAVELSSPLASLARENLASLQIENVQVKTGDGVYGGPYGGAKLGGIDDILVCGSLPYLPAVLRNQLNIGGHLIIVVGQGPVMQVELHQRQSKTEWSALTLFESALAPLSHNLKATSFTF